MQWTNEQAQAINEKGNNILVAAAAGSGKTAVLVERIISKIINEKIDIDKILVVTFTNLAAGQMRERILDRIYKKIEEEPDNEHLQRQIALLPKANICTIDSFCLDIVKNNFFVLDISPNFRIADEVELKILKQETLEEMFENKYEKQEENFLKLVNTYTTYRGDENLKEIVLKIHNYIQSTPYPEKWLNQQIEKFNLDEEIDFSKTQWGKILYENSKDDILDAILQLKDIRGKAEKEPEIPKIYVTLSEDVRKLEKVYEANNWEELYKNLQEFFFDRWSKDKNAPEELVQELKSKRELVKKNIEDIKKNIIIYNSETANQDTKDLYETMKLIGKLVIEYENELREKKKEKNIVDFSDIEHYALLILIKNDEQSEIAIKYQNKFEEIAIDEYQDSNMVQEYILTTISRKNNIFMVGDVKQSIYKFRQAMPELFLQKYETYKLKEDKQEKDSLKIKLFKNFRSRKEILNLTNLIFQNIMSKEFGEIEYNEEEYLNLGDKEYPEGKNLLPELHIIETNQEQDEIIAEQISHSKARPSDENEPIDNIVLEAKFVASKIKQMIDEGYMVCDKNKTYKKATYRDFAILLRSTKNIANIFEKELMALNIPVFCDATSEYLDSFEIQIIMNILRVIDNPTSDIPQITVMRSPIENFSDNELIKIRNKDKNKSFYSSMKEYMQNKEGEQQIKNKIEKYLEKINTWREKSKYLPLDELIWSIYMETGFYNYVSLMPNGEYRLANLKMLFEKAKQYETTSFKGVFNFINFIDKLKITSGDMNGAKLIGENENVVRIMSIHKSKGLEFPIVILSRTGKKFNIMDINNEDIILHNELGIGCKFIDTELNVKVDTLSKKAVANKAKQELIAEELRILYVALTRAKEKMIITGIEKDIEKELLNKQEILKCYEKYNNDKISKNILKKYMRYLDFFELIYLYNKDKIENILKVEKHKQSEIINSVQENSKEQNTISSVEEQFGYLPIEKNQISMEEDKREPCILSQDNNEEQQLQDKLNWKYEYITSTKIETKSSVSKIKQMTQENYNNIEETNEEISFAEPKFLKEETQISQARKGTLTHLVLQKLNEKEEYTIEKIKALIEELINREIITKKEATNINTEKIYKFTTSEIFNQMKTAKKVYKEQPFYINIPAKGIYNIETEDKILVQGIIDLFYITQDNKITLIDYKTDYVPKGKEEQLKEKYQKQLELYKTAIEGMTKKKVDNVYIYSTYLEKTVKIM